MAAEPIQTKMMQPEEQRSLTTEIALTATGGAAGGAAGAAVTFINRGNTVVGTLFVPAGRDADTGPAIVITHPFGAVKEQVSTTYAELLTEQGFTTLVFDASFQGESGGEPHFSDIPAVRVEDIRCAVDFLTTRREVDAARIGALGICAGGGYTINAASTDYRIKAVAAVSTFDVGRARREGIGGSISPERRDELLHQIGEQRTAEAAGAPVKYYSLIRDDPTFDMSNPSTIPQMYQDGYVYYTQVAANDRSMSEFVLTTMAQQMAFFPFELIELISPRPLLLIAGSNADTRNFSEDAYAKAKEPKELALIDGASHIDLYWKPEYVPQVAERLTGFFRAHL
jgi:fermentation-respiration switch protein FrsA (DUF1100 family)